MALKIKWSNKSGVEFCERFTYLLSTKAIQLLLSKAVNENLTTIFEELMFTGILAEKIGVERLHMPKHFAQGEFKTDCGCDGDGMPFLISKQENVYSGDIANLSSYSNFASISCPNNSSQKSVEYFAACIAHSG
uniref:Uncharacterized protein n=1 Tax=Panagrolaimus sp. ES5 TaxID=591445 RepID=A0AC34GUQ4_9BILA